MRSLETWLSSLRLGILLISAMLVSAGALLGCDKSPDELVSDLGSGSHEDVEEAMSDLRRAGPAAKHALLRGLRAEGADVRERAAEVIGTLCAADAEYELALRGLLEDPVSRVRYSAASALGSIKLYTLSKDTVGSIVRVALNTEEQNLVRASAIVAMRRFGTEESVPDEVLSALRTLLRDPGLLQVTAGTLTQLGRHAMPLLPYMEELARESRAQLRGGQTKAALLERAISSIERCE